MWLSKRKIINFKAWHHYRVYPIISQEVEREDTIFPNNEKVARISLKFKQILTENRRQNVKSLLRFKDFHYRLCQKLFFGIHNFCLARKGWVSIGPLFVTLDKAQTGCLHL